MSREIKRVPVDFDWPLDKTWSGFLLPAEFHFPTCDACAGTGYSPEAQAVAETFYPHQIRDGYGADRAHAERLAWHNKIGQAEVDNLVAHRRLPVWENGQFVNKPRTAAEVNAQQNDMLDAHDGLNRSLLIQFRCERLGITLACPVCDGAGDIATKEQRAAANAWKPTPPPTGEGWQLWESVSEGSPITPVFATAAELVDYLVQFGPIGEAPYRRAAAEALVEAGSSMGSLVMRSGEVFSGSHDLDRLLS